MAARCCRRSQVRKPQGNAPVDTPTSDENLEALTKYGIDLTANAAHLDPVIGRWVSAVLERRWGDAFH